MLCSTVVILLRYCADNELTLKYILFKTNYFVTLEYGNEYTNNSIMCLLTSQLLIIFCMVLICAEISIWL